MDAIRASWRLALGVESVRGPVEADRAIDPNRAVSDANARIDSGERTTRPIASGDAGARSQLGSERSPTQTQQRGASHGPEPPPPDAASERARERERWAQDMAVRLSLAKSQQPDGLFHGPPTYDWKVGPDGQPYRAAPLALDPRITGGVAPEEGDDENQDAAPVDPTATDDSTEMVEGGTDPPANDASSPGPPSTGDARKPVSADLAPGPSIDAWA